MSKEVWTEPSESLVEPNEVEWALFPDAGDGVLRANRDTCVRWQSGNFLARPEMHEGYAGDQKLANFYHGCCSTAE